MMDDLTFTLNSPITDEQWDAITDVDFDKTDRIGFITKNGKQVEFEKIVRCKDCKHKYIEEKVWNCPFGLPGGEEFFCSYGARIERENDE